METKNKKLFFVSLEGVDLTDEQLKKIDKGIQQVVLKEISKIDNSKEFIVNQHLGTIPIKPGKWPFPWGIIVRPPHIPIDTHIKDISAQIAKELMLK